MFGSMPAPSGVGGMVNAPSVPPSVTPTMPQSPNFLSTIFKALFDPDSAAVDMANSGMTPADFTQQLQGNKLSDIMQQQAQVGRSQRGAPASSLFGGEPLIDRGLYNLPKVGAGDTGAGDGSKLSQLMQPQAQAQAQVQQPSQQQPQRQPLVTSGDFPADVSGGAGGNPLITMNDILDLFRRETTAPQVQPQRVQPIQQIGGPGGIPPQVSPPPIVPPIVPQSVQPLPPIAPPVVGQDITPPTLPVDAVAGAQPQQPQQQLPLNPNVSRANVQGNTIYDAFMNTIKAGGVTNPNALAAIAATGKSESGFVEKNVFGSWSDPSEKGQAGTSGGVMSWRAERLNAMRNFVKENGGDINRPSPELQAKFLLQEDPSLIAKLNAAKSPEEAQTLMNNAWKFAGYDKPGTGEAARRIALAKTFAEKFGAGGTGSDVAGGDPWAGMREGAGAGAGAAAAGTPAAPEGSLASRLADISSALEAPAGGGRQDLNLPQAPSPVPPRPGQFSPDANVMRTILAMLYGGGGGGQIPSLTQLRTGQG